MVFVQEQLPPIIEKAINEIQNHNGQVTHKQFKEIFYKLRISKEDINYYKKYLETLNLVDSNNRKIELKEHNHLDNTVLLTCPECGYEWNYKGKNYRTACPRCQYNNKWTYIKTGL